MKEIGYGLAWVVVDVRGLVHVGGEKGRGAVEYRKYDGDGVRATALAAMCKR